MITPEDKIALYQFDVLLITNDPEFNRLLSLSLKNVGHNVKCLDSFAERYLEAIQEFKPDIIYVDISAEPQGPDVIKTILSTDIKARIAAIDTNYSDERLYTMRELGAKGYIPKNLEPVYFMEQIFELMGGKACYARIVSEVRMLIL